MRRILEMRGISKIYPGGRSWANQKVSLHLQEGEILCLAGENGAGKTTLMKILYGLTPPTEGEIWVNGKRARINSPLDAYTLGIGMVHQHFMLFPEFTVAQNVVMGIEPVRGGIFYDFAQAGLRVGEVIRRHHFSIEPGAPVQSLTVGQMQQVEIVKLLYRDVDIFILDEPTAVLTDQEVQSLFRTLRTLAESGKSLILITHKLREIKQIADRVAIMRKGELIGAYLAKDMDEYEISRLMVGQGVDPGRPPRRPVPAEAPPVITFEEVVVKRRDQERPLLDRVSFTARGGEILGFAGVGGNGLGVLEAVLGGFLHIVSGRILHQGKDISRLKTRGLRRRGLAYVPADRLIYGSALDATVRENLIINRRRRFSRWGVLDMKAIGNFAGELIARYRIRGNMAQSIGSLSGGNIQKVILAREIDQDTDYIVFSEPTRGLDVAASGYVYEQMAALRDRGAAVILISSNLEEILANADRILVFYRGTIAAEIRNAPGESAGGETGGSSGDVPGAPGHGPEPGRDIKAEIGAYMLGLKTGPSGPESGAAHG